MGAVGNIGRGHAPCAVCVRRRLSDLGSVIEHIDGEIEIAACLALVDQRIGNLTGSSFADKLVGDARANVLDGGPGGDRLEGGLGSDTASYARATAGVTADLTKSANNTVEAAGDTYLSIENLAGSKFADRLVGDQNANVLSGSDGADTLIANAGNDRLIGGLGPDILNGGAGNDVYVLLSAKDGVATFQGFVVKDDQIEVSASGFPGLVAGQKLVDGVTFISGASPLAPTTKATFLYDTKTQDLYFDDDGSGVHGAQKIVHFDTPVTLHANDFDIVA
jgi:Ca2+-binding RTX toxin-like protein